MSKRRKHRNKLHFMEPQARTFVRRSSQPLPVTAGNENTISSQTSSSQKEELHRPQRNDMVRERETSNRTDVLSHRAGRHQDRSGVSASNGSGRALRRVTERYLSPPTTPWPTNTMFERNTRQEGFHQLETFKNETTNTAQTDLSESNDSGRVKESAAHVPMVKQQTGLRKDHSKSPDAYSAFAAYSFSNNKLFKQEKGAYVINLENVNWTLPFPTMYGMIIDPSDNDTSQTARMDLSESKDSGRVRESAAHVPIINQPTGLTIYNSMSPDVYSAVAAYSFSNNMLFQQEQEAEGIYLENTSPFSTIDGLIIDPSDNETSKTAQTDLSESNDSGRVRESAAHVPMVKQQTTSPFSTIFGVIIDPNDNETSKTARTEQCFNPNSAVCYNMSGVYSLLEGNPATLIELQIRTFDEVGLYKSNVDFSKMPSSRFEFIYVDLRGSGFPVGIIDKMMPDGSILIEPPYLENRLFAQNDGKVLKYPDELTTTMFNRHRPVVTTNVPAKPKFEIQKQRFKVTPDGKLHFYQYIVPADQRDVPTILHMIIPLQGEDKQKSLEFPEENQQHHTD